jgi:hypothetical protein
MDDIDRVTHGVRKISFRATVDHQHWRAPAFGSTKRNKLRVPLRLYS